MGVGLLSLWACGRPPSLWRIYGYCTYAISNSQHTGISHIQPQRAALVRTWRRQVRLGLACLLQARKNKTPCFFSQRHFGNKIDYEPTNCGCVVSLPYFGACRSCATWCNKQISLATRTSLKTPSCFLRSCFSRVREKRQGSNDTLFFRSSLRFLAKEKQATCFSARVFRLETKTRL